jgi:hypothetical protein
MAVRSPAWKATGICRAGDFDAFSYGFYTVAEVDTPGAAPCLPRTNPIRSGSDSGEEDAPEFKVEVR